MHRVLIPPHAIQGDRIVIGEATTLHHVRDVLRLRAGDRLECFDGQGRSYAGTIVGSSRNSLNVAVDREAVEPQDRLQVTLAQALIKPERFEWCLQKATELGVARILPMVTSRTTVRLPAAHAGGRLARWRRIIE